jgi:uncharacterized membrane protein (UPF0127 family)
METDEWQQKMLQIVETARALSGLDVVDLNFDNGDSLEVYIALTEDQRIRGLSDVATLDLGGMLFYFERDSYAPFTAKKMVLDIDIAWYDRSGSLLQKKHVPAGTGAVYCDRPFAFVLEALPGTIPDANLGLKG